MSEWPHFRNSRPRGGACYLDFVDVWFWQAWKANDLDGIKKWASEMAHWAMAMHPELGKPEQG